MYSIQLFIDFISQYKWTIIFYLICTCLAFPIETLLLPQLYSGFFEAIRKQPTQEIFLYYFGLMFLLLMFVNLANFATNVIEADLIPEWKGFFMNWIFEQLLVAHENQMTDIELGKLIVDLIFFPKMTRDLISEIVTFALPRFLAILFVQVYFFTIDFHLGLLALLLLVAFCVFSVYSYSLCKPLAEEEHVEFEEKMQKTQDRLSNTFSIYSVGNMEKEIANYIKQTDQYTEVDKSKLHCLNRANIYTSLYILFMMLSLNGYATTIFLQKKIPFTTLMSMYMIIMYYIPSVGTINTIVPGFFTKMAIIQSKDDFLAQLYKQYTPDSSLSLKTHKKSVLNTIQGKQLKTGNIEIRHLNFSYSFDLKPLFHDFSLKIHDKSKWAIMGPSGCGKSSLIKLIMGYYSVPNNTIFIDGQDINSYDLNSLRQQISYVNQNTKLFNMTLYENICYGNEENQSQEKIAKLIQSLGLQEVFRNMNLNDSCGVDGNNLSGGQRQIVHLLRCILRKNHIVILDEPTSALDPDLKSAVVRAIRILSNQSTLIIITHDESLLFLVDRVLRLDSPEK